MNRKERRSARFLTESEILAEFETGDAELVRQLLGLRQTPGAALQQRIQAIPHPATEQATVVTQPSGPQRGEPVTPQPESRRWGRMLRPLVVGVGAAVVLAVALLAVSPGFRAAAAQAIGEIRQLLGDGSLRELPYCNAPDVRILSPLTGDGGLHQLPVFGASGPLLGQVSDQRFKGVVVIELVNPELSPDPDSVALAVFAGFTFQEVLEPALRTLQDPEVPMQALRYPAMRVRVSYESEPPCLMPDPAEQGYVLIEVWDEQVKIGYGGAGAALKERAIKALMAELQKVR